MEYIKRAIEDVAEHSRQTFKCVLITGARQVGKSTLVKNLFPELRRVSFDDQFLEEQAQTNPAMFLVMNPPPAFYDEVQRVPNLFRQIKIACDDSDDRGLFVLSGSQAFDLMKRVTESLSGRVSILELPTLSLREITHDAFCDPFLPTLDYLQRRQQTAQAPENIWQLIHRGGYPELQNPAVSWEEYFASYVRTYLERDVRGLSAVQDLMTFRRFMIAVAARTGQMLNYSNIADEIGKDADTVKAWTSILAASNIIYIMEPYANSVLKKAIKTPKVYFCDTGLAAYLTRWLTPETLANGAMSGAFYETYIISEILKSYSNRGLDYRYYVSYYRGKDKQRRDSDGSLVSREAEIDLIIERDGILYPIEIKQAASVSADKTAAFTILDQLPDRKRGTGAVICNCPAPGTIRDNIFQIPVWYI